MAGKRVYVSPLRAQAAEQTREEILRQASKLFAEPGYGRVTVAEIARAAGVSPKTVFASVGSKSHLLNLVVDRAVEASGYRQAMAHILTLSTPEDVLTALARGTRLGNEHQFDVHEAIRKALPVCEDGDSLWQRATADYRDALTQTARHTCTLTPTPTRSPEELADLLWLWFGPSAWRTLVIDSGWSWDRAEDVLRRTALVALA